MDAYVATDSILGEDDVLGPWDLVCEQNWMSTGHETNQNVPWDVMCQNAGKLSHAFNAICGTGPGLSNDPRLTVFPCRGRDRCPQKDTKQSVGGHETAVAGQGRRLPSEPCVGGQRPRFLGQGG